MEFTSPPELITSITDLIDSMAAAVFLALLAKDKSKKATLWKVMMWSLLISGMMGFFVHLIDWSENVENITWILLPLPMCIAVSAFFALSVVEVCANAIKTAVIFSSAMCSVSYAAMVVLFLAEANFLVIFTIFAALFVFAAGIIFGVVFAKTKRKYLLFYMIGVVIEIPGGIVQAKRDLYFKFIVEMDFNSVFHLLLLLSIVLFTVGYLAQRKTDDDTVK